MKEGRGKTGGAKGWNAGVQGYIARMTSWPSDADHVGVLFRKKVKA